MRDLSEGTNDQTNQVPNRLLQVPKREDDAPTGLNGEYNSLYAIHKVGMEVERWWLDSVQGSVFHVFNIGASKRSSSGT